MSDVGLSLLHDHLDGGLRVATVLDIADSIDWQLPTTEPSALAAWFTAGAASGDLLQYLATFEHTLAVMQTEEHIERVAYEAAVDLAADGVVYAEVRFAPELHQQQGLSLDAVVAAVTAGFRRGEAEVRAGGADIYIGAILCAMRTEQRSMEIAQLVDRLREDDDKVLAFDLAGAETGWPPSLHAEALEFARERHLNITIHASEPPDLELISDALAHGAHRIGHGVRLLADMTIDDGEITSMGPLARFVLDRQIPLEMAPTCHVHVGAVPDIASHPIGPMLRAGFDVSVNTDNRLMSAVMPSTEMALLRSTFGLTDDEVRQLVRNGVAAGFAPIERRREILASL
ncbi:MAG: adenosine deaminase [Ilumatobacter sp.]|uniref:adenosine deaminase n=1 Tax=Ilumatobacter sp. TaxID=1967498 RepID=UPI00391C0DEC